MNKKPILINLSEGSSRSFSSQDLAKVTNGAFLCDRGGKVTFAIKVNGLLIPTDETRARILPRLAKRLGGTTRSWCEAWSLVNIPATNVNK